MTTEYITLYRYHNTHDVVRLETFHNCKRTPMGAQIRLPYTYPVKTKFVLLSGKKRYAYPTEEEAKVSFLARKARQKAILQHQLEMLEIAVINMRMDNLNTRTRAYVEFE